MKIKELIKELKRYSQELEVKVSDSYGGEDKDIAEISITVVTKSLKNKTIDKTFCSIFTN